MLLFIGVNLLWLGAGFITGVTSFGGNLIAVPMLAFIIDPGVAILEGNIVGFTMAAVLSIFYRKNIIWKELLILFPGLVAGLPFGINFLNYAGTQSILVLAGVALLAFLGWRLLQIILKHPQKRFSSFWGIPFDIFSGFLTASIVMGGPPLALYAFLRKWNQRESIFMVNFAAMICMTLAVITQWHLGRYARPVIEQSLYGALFAACGTALSVPVASRMRKDIFNRMLFVILIVSAFAMLFRGLFSNTV